MMIALKVFLYSSKLQGLCIILEIKRAKFCAKREEIEERKAMIVFDTSPGSVDNPSAGYFSSFF